MQRNDSIVCGNRFTTAAPFIPSLPRSVVVPLVIVNVIALSLFLSECVEKAAWKNRPMSKGRKGVRERERGPLIRGGLPSTVQAKAASHLFGQGGGAWDFEESFGELRFFSLPMLVVKLGQRDSTRS